MMKTGFGFLRIPQLSDGSIDYEKLNPIVDEFLNLGGRYFDTAYTYLDGLSEEAIKRSLVQRYPRDSFSLANKLPAWLLNNSTECETYFNEQLRRCGVDYFDVYLLHSLDAPTYDICKRTNQFEFLQHLKDTGKAEYTGFSYHDSAALLDHILTEHPEIDYVQLQINYLDWKSVTVQAKECYDTAVRHGKKVIVMEPVKGGTLATPPAEAAQLLHASNPSRSLASWAIHFASNLDNVAIVLSGMNELQQIRDNLITFPPLTESELNTLAQAAEIIRNNTAIACTACSYCTSDCPMQIQIPKLFALYNEFARTPDDVWKMQHLYDTISSNGAPASACIRCRQCERHCPQKLQITDYLADVAKAFETNE